MKQDKIKQVICISERNAMDFQDRMNEALSQLSDPEIRTYENQPFIATIVYTVRRDLPENVLELFEMIEDRSYTCEACPHFVRSEDKRKKWGSCALTCERTRSDSRACERFYVYRYKVLSEAKEQYLQIPFSAE